MSCHGLIGFHKVTFDHLLKKRHFWMATVKFCSFQVKLFQFVNQIVKSNVRIYFNFENVCRDGTRLYIVFKGFRKNISWFVILASVKFFNIQVVTNNNLVTFAKFELKSLITHGK